MFTPHSVPGNGFLYAGISSQNTFQCEIMPSTALICVCVYPRAALNLHDLQSFFSSMCLSHMCFMFVLLTLNIQRYLYLAEYEILTAGPNYREYPLLGCDIFHGNGSTFSVIYYHMMSI
jgi:hypothetical protein